MKQEYCYISWLTRSAFLLLAYVAGYLAKHAIDLAIHRALAVEEREGRKWYAWNCQRRGKYTYTSRSGGGRRGANIYSHVAEVEGVGVGGNRVGEHLLDYPKYLSKQGDTDTLEEETIKWMFDGQLGNLDQSQHV